MEGSFFNLIRRDGFCLTETAIENMFIFFREDGQPFQGDWEMIVRTAVEYYRAYAERFPVEAPSKCAIEVDSMYDDKVLLLYILDLDTVKH